MSETWTDQELEAFLVRLNPNYRKYAAKVCGVVTSREELANANQADLMEFGIAALHATNIIAKAGNTGQLSATKVQSPVHMHSKCTTISSSLHLPVEYN